MIAVTERPRVLARTTGPSVVLARSDYSETSLVVKLLVRGCGKLRLLAKGAKRPRSPMRGLDIAEIGAAAFIDKGPDRLGILTGWSPAKRLPALRTSLARLGAAYRILELADAAIDEREPNEDVFDLVVDSLEAAAAMDAPGLLVLAVEARVLELAGYGIDLETCAGCGAPVPKGRQAVTLVADEGGLYCGRCRRAGPGARKLSAGALATLRALKGADVKKVARLTASAIIMAELDGALAAVVKGFLHKDLRTNGGPWL